MNIDVIYSKMFCVDRLNPLGRVYYTKLRKIIEMLCGAIFYDPRGQTGRAKSVTRGGVHLQYIYIYNLFQKGFTLIG